MLITIENFGAIKHFQFDTEKDLYLIFGKNSVGKSYAISLVYLVIKKIKELNLDSVVTTLFLSKEFNSDIDKLEKYVQENNIGEIDVSNDFKKHLTFCLEHFLISEINKSIANSFNGLFNLQNKFSNKKLKITINSSGIIPQVDLTISLGLKKDSNKNISFVIIKYHFNSKVFLKKSTSLFNEKQIKYDYKKIILYLPDQEKSLFKSNFLAMVADCFYRFSDELQKISTVYYLPASRSGLYQGLNSFSQILAELSKSSSSTSKSIALPSLSEPVADYFLHLSNINNSNEESDGFIAYANEIEKEILQGVVEFDNKNKKLFFTPNKTSLKLDLSTTSSMVSEISPIVSYIKYIFPTQRTSKKDQKPLVFIEEPEAHLHPATQVKLMAVFARLVKDNKIKLVMTSHSNYIFNKASNLVIDNKIDKEKFEAILFKSTPEGSIARNLDTDEYGIEDDNFIDTAESIYEEKLELINKLNG
ncbi:MAG: AAA family ATPase [Methylococcaceae bacterium]